MKTERLFLPRVRAVVRACAVFFFCVFAHGAFAQNDAGAKLNPWFSQLDLSFAGGGTYANIKEFVYKKNSAGKHALLSRLDWKNIVMRTVGAKLGCDISRWRLALDFSTALPVPGSSSMQDRDWETLGSAPTDYSEHPARLDSFFGTGVSLAYRFWDTQTLILGAGAGFAYTATNLTAYDGSASLPSQKNYSGDVVSYSQRIYKPRLMLYGEWKPSGLFETHARLFASPFTFIRATDTHYAIVDASGASLAPTIGKQFSDRLSGPASFRAELALRFNLPQKKSAGQTGDQTENEQRPLPASSVRHAFALQADAAFVPEIKGASYSRSWKSMPFAKTENIAGSSYFSFGISLAYCMRIR